MEAPELFCNCCGAPSLEDPCSEECFEAWCISESKLIDELCEQNKEKGDIHNG